MENRAQIIELSFNEPTIVNYNLWVGEDLTEEEWEALKEALPSLRTFNSVAQWLEENTEMETPLYEADSSTDYEEHATLLSVFELEKEVYKAPEPSNEGRLNDLRSHLMSQVKEGWIINPKKTDMGTEETADILWELPIAEVRDDNSGEFISYYLVGFNGEKFNGYPVNLGEEIEIDPPLVSADVLTYYVTIQNAK